MPPPPTEPSPAASDHLLHMLRQTILCEVRANVDLTLRQTAVFLTTYFTDESQTVRGLAQHLAVNKPAVTRALDRLGEIDLARLIHRASGCRLADVA